MELSGKYARFFQPINLESNLYSGFPKNPQQTFELESVPGFARLSPEKQNELREKAINSMIEARATAGALTPFTQPQYTLDELGRFREQEALRAQALGKESLREAYKYTTLANIPKAIAQGFGNIASTNLYAGQAVADTFAKTLANYPQAQFSQYSFQPQKYFS